MDCESFRKKDVLSAEAVERKHCSYISIYFVSGCFSIKRNKVSNVSMKYKYKYKYNMGHLCQRLYIS